MKALQENFYLEEQSYMEIQKLTEKNSTENLNGQQEQIDNNVVVLQSDIAEVMKEDPLLNLKIINKALNRENKNLKEQIKMMGEAGVNKAKEKSNATNG